MDIESAGKIGGAGIVGAVMAYLGFRREVDGIREEIKGIKSRVVYRDVCDVCSKATCTQFKSVESKLDYIIERIDRGMTYGPNKSSV